MHSNSSKYYFYPLLVWCYNCPTMFAQRQVANVRLTLITKRCDDEKDKTTPCSCPPWLSPSSILDLSPSCLHLTLSIPFCPFSAWRNVCAWHANVGKCSGAAAPFPWTLMDVGFRDNEAKSPYPLAIISLSDLLTTRVYEDVFTVQREEKVFEQSAIKYVS